MIDLKIGTLILCEKKCGPRRACLRCKSKVFEIRPGKGPHFLGLSCALCSSDFRWLSKEAADQITDADIPSIEKLEELDAACGYPSGGPYINTDTSFHWHMEEKMAENQLFWDMES